jgi:hypothetical protein
MVQSYMDNFGTYLQYGTDKAWPDAFGEYQVWGPNRIIEGLLDLTGASYNTLTLSTSASAPTIISNTTFFPAMPAGKMFIEKIEVVCETAAASGTTFNLGLIQTDRATIPSGYATGLLSAVATASFDTAGKQVTYFTGVSGVGALVGTGPTEATGPYYLTSHSTGTYTAGLLRVRIHWHPVIGSTIGSNISK